MLYIQKLGMNTARNYFKEEFSHASNSYFSQDGRAIGRWSGQLAAELGLSGHVTEEQYMRLIEGQHPITGEQLIKHRETSRSREGLENSHVPGWDIGFSLPKEWSLAAVVGGDERIFRIAEKANAEVLRVLEAYAQAHTGHGDITTGKLAMATFRHETSRPVNGYSSPQIHFHSIAANVQETNGHFRALDPEEMYKAKSYALQAGYDMLARLGREAGYNLDWTENLHSPAIRGISREYVEHESDREKLILAEMKERGLSGGQSAHEVAKYNREEKLKLTPEEFISLQKEHGLPFAEELKVVPEAFERGPVQFERTATAEQAVTHAERSLSERHATFEHYQLAREALRYGLGTIPRADIETEIQRQLETRELVQIHHYRDHAPGARYTTRQTLELERETVARVLSGQNSVQPILEHASLGHIKELADNEPRQRIIEAILGTRDQIVAVNGVAGSAKSSAAGILRAFAEAQGFRVKGLAPTGTAAASLREKGISTDTLQKHLETAKSVKQQGKTFYILDETSLASTKQIHAFLGSLKPQDHVLLVGDDASDPRKVGQHTSVEAGRVFQLLQDAGMRTAHFNKIYRQKAPELKAVVSAFRYGQPEQALALLTDQGRIQEQPNSHERYRDIARSYAEQPKGTLVVSPDNESRMDLNTAIRGEMRKRGSLGKEAYLLPVLVNRDLTTEDTRRASAYRVGDVLQYRKGNKEVGVKARDYATVIERDTDNNRLTVKKQDGRFVTYDPARAFGVNAFESRPQEFSAGERVQFTARDKKLGTYTRDTGTVRSLDSKGNAEVVLDRGDRVARFNLKDHRHLDHGYTMTSHSAQSQTVERVLINVNSNDSRLRGLLNEVFAYVAASRPEYDLRIFADQTSGLMRVFGRENEQRKAMAPREIATVRERAMIQQPEVTLDQGISL